MLSNVLFGFINLTIRIYYKVVNIGIRLRHRGAIT